MFNSRLKFAFGAALGALVAHKLIEEDDKLNRPAPVSRNNNEED